MRGGANSFDPKLFAALGRNILTLRTAEEIKSTPEQPYLIKGLLPAQGVAAIFGESGSAKSFLAMDLTFAIGTGRPEWFGLRLRQARVVYVALEGQGGLARRIRAWEVHHNRGLTSEVLFRTSNFAIDDSQSVEELAEEVSEMFGRGGVVVIDTLNQAAPGADENSSADMGRMIAGAQALAARIEGLVLLIHHSGKDRSRGLRGHSSLFAALDAVVEVSSDDDYRSWRCTKAKDDELGPRRYFSLKRYNVGKDADGEDIWSCAVVMDLNGASPKLPKLTGRNQIALREAVKRQPQDLTWDEALDVAAAALTKVPQERRRSRAKSILERLLQSGHLLLTNGVICTAS